MKFLPWVQSPSILDMDIVKTLAKELKSYEDDLKRHQSRISKFEFLTPKLQRIILRDLDNYHIARESIQLVKCADIKQKKGYGEKKGEALEIGFLESVR